VPTSGQFHHVVLEVTDLQRSERFYGESIGLEPVGRGAFPEDGPNAAFVTGDGQYMVLVERPEVKTDGPGVHTNFMVPTEEYHTVYDRLKALGCLVIDHRAEQRSVGEVSTYFTDPDGHRLQITALEPEAFVVPPSRQGKVVAGRIEDFPVGSVTRNRAGRFFIVRLQEGVLAINEICTHMHCLVTYQKEHYRFYCACHYNKFSRKGEHIGHTPGVPPLHTYAIEFVDGQVVVDTDTTHPRSTSEAETMVPVPEPSGARRGGQA
jgi:catechol 2,3-dioxygenase-like lactoylglutathione lyase family enzyme/nitrite reductase/ring-hydroxylating ferredoxin subunit